MALSFSSLPSDIHICLSPYLTTNDIKSLSQTCLHLKLIYLPLSWSVCSTKLDASSLDLDEIEKIGNDYYQSLEDPSGTNKQTLFKSRVVPIHVVLNPEKYSWFLSASVKTLIIDSQCIPSIIEYDSTNNSSVSDISANLQVLRNKLFSAQDNASVQSIASGSDTTDSNSSKTPTSESSSTEDSSSTLVSLPDSDSKTSSLTTLSSQFQSTSEGQSSISSRDQSTTISSDQQTPISDNYSPSSASLAHDYALLSSYLTLQNVHFTSDKTHIDINEINGLLKTSGFWTALITHGCSITVGLSIDLGPFEFASRSDSVSLTNFQEVTERFCESSYLETVTSLKLTVLKYDGNEFPIPFFSNLSTINLSVPDASIFQMVLNQLPKFRCLKSFHSSHTCTFRNGTISVDHALRSISQYLSPGIETCIIQVFFVTGLTASGPTNVSFRTDTDENSEVLSLENQQSFILLPQVTHIECHALSNDIPLEYFFACVSLPRLCHFSIPFAFNWNPTNLGFQQFTTVIELNLFITNTDFQLLFLRFLSFFTNLEFLSISMSGCPTYTSEFDNLNKFLKVIRQLYQKNNSIVFKEISDFDLQFLIRKHIPQLCIESFAAKTMVQVLVNLVKHPLKFSDRLDKCKTFSQYRFIIDAYVWECVFQLIQRFHHFKFLNIHSYGYAHASPRLQRILVNSLRRSSKMQQILFTQQVSYTSLKSEKGISENCDESFCFDHTGCGCFDATYGTRGQQLAFENAPIFSPTVSVCTNDSPDICIQNLYDLQARKYFEPKLITHQLMNIREKYDIKSQSPFNNRGVGGPVDPNKFSGWV